MAADKPRSGPHSYAFGQASGPADAGPAVLATVGCDPIYLAPFHMPGSEVEELPHPLFLSDSWCSVRLLLTNNLICWASRAGWSIGTRV